VAIFRRQATRICSPSDGQTLTISWHERLPPHKSARSLFSPDLQSCRTRTLTAEILPAVQNSPQPVIYHGDDPWDEPTSLRDKVAAVEPLTAFVPDMQVILADLSQLSPESLADTPELEARIRTLQLARWSKPEFESIATIFRLLRDWAKKDSQKEALKDIFLYLCQVFNAQRICGFNQAVRTGLQIESETPMPTIYEVLIEPRLEKATQ